MLEGESRLAEDNYLLAELRIENLRPAPAGEVKVKLKFKINEKNDFFITLQEQGNEANAVLQKIDL